MNVFRGSWPVFRFLLVFFIFLANKGVAQTDDGNSIGYTAERKKVALGEDKRAHCRIWYYGGESAVPVALVCESGNKEQIFIDNNLRPGLESPYFDCKPGQFRLHVLPGDTAPPAEGERLPLEASALAAPVDFAVGAGDFCTVVLRQMDGKFLITTVKDELPSEGSEPTINVANFSSLSGWEIRLLSNPAKRDSGMIVWNEAMGGTASIRLRANEVLYLSVSRKVEGVSKPINFFEVRMGRGTGGTIVLQDGRRGKGGAKLLFDGLSDGR